MNHALMSSRLNIGYVIPMRPVINPIREAAEERCRRRILCMDAHRMIGDEHGLDAIQTSGSQVIGASKHPVMHNRVDTSLELEFDRIRCDLLNADFRNHSLKVGTFDSPHFTFPPIQISQS
jgi:hypothetical protein